MTVERILENKSADVVTVKPDELISAIIEKLEAEDVGALVVSKNGSTVDGIISERDVVRGLARFGPDVLEHPVSELMTEDVVTCTEIDRIVGVMALMDAHQIRHIPVVNRGKLAGIVGSRDIIKLRVEELQSEADIMRSYIAG